MILSNKHKFIFLKNHKVAGTAVEISLSRYCKDKEDIITEVDPEFEKIRRRFSVSPKNHRNKKTIIESHASAEQIYEYVGHKTWITYKKIIIERHPYDRVLSQYYMDQVEQRDGSVSFEEWIFDPKWSKSRSRNSDKLFFRNSIAPDVFLRYECLQEELTELMKYLGMDFDGWLPEIRVGLKKDKSLLTGPIKERIYFENKFIFDRMGYSK
jgi:hypothetical protein